MTDTEHMETFRSNLSLIKLMSGDKAEEEFYNLMEKAKKTFGDLHLYMGELYFEYAKYFIEKMEKNTELFNTQGLPAVQDANRVQSIQEDECEEEDSSDQPPSKVEEAKNEPTITEDKQAAPAEADNEENNKQGNNIEVEEDGDFEVCAQNLCCAIQIYEAERTRIQEGGVPHLMDLSEVKRYISRCKSRLGDLYHLNENYQQAVDVYREVITEEEKKIGHQSNRGLAEIHYMVANSFLYENKDGCQVKALLQFFQSANILVSKVKELNPEDSTVFQIPSMEKIKVDRFAYLPKLNECDETKDIKEVISCLLDKIEDTHEQISIRKQYQDELIKMKEKSVQQTFKEISPEVPVVKLGTFGNRKKKTEGEVGEKSQKQQNPEKKEQKQDKKDQPNS